MRLTNKRAGTSLKLIRDKVSRFSLAHPTGQHRHSRSLSLNDDGMAYSWVMVVAAIIVFGLAWIILTPLMNPVIDIMNDEIDDGHVSQQTSDAFSFQLALWLGIPGILLVGFFIHIVQRAIERSKLGGGNQ